MKKNLLITGGAGFVGANLAIFFKKRFKNLQIICFDNLIRQGSGLNVARLKANGITFVKGDIRYKKSLFNLPKIHGVIECSAEPSVLAGYENPQYTIDTNLIGTINCLELARRDQASFLFLSTSRVYPIDSINAISSQELKTRFDWNKNLKASGISYAGLREDFSLLGRRSLYGATKLASEHLITEFGDMFGLKTIINRLGVIAGPWQMGRIDQGIVGYWIARHYFGGSLKFIGYGGEGKQVRDVIHVDDVCELIAYQWGHLNKMSNQIFNVGGGRRNSVSLLELTEMIGRLTKKKIPIGSEKKERRADVKIYITDNSRVMQETGWVPKKNIEIIILDTYRWIEQNNQRLVKILA